MALLAQFPLAQRLCDNNFKMTAEVFSIERRTALVIGGTSGMGLEIALGISPDQRQRKLLLFASRVRIRAVGFCRVAPSGRLIAGRSSR